MTDPAELLALRRLQAAEAACEAAGTVMKMVIDSHPDAALFPEEQELVAALRRWREARAGETQT